MNDIVKLNYLENQVLNNIANSKAGNTLRAYKSDFQDFKNFCLKYNFSDLPSSPKIVGIYLNDLSSRFKFSTIKRRLASINCVHRLKGHYLDCSHPLIKENLIGIKRNIGINQKSKKPLLYNNLINIINLINKDIEYNFLQKKRDKAILLIGFSGGFRRSELSSLNPEDIEFVEEGVKITIKKSKTDQYGKGFQKGIPYFRNKSYCPVIALKEWLKIRIEHERKKTLFQCSDRTIALIIKKYTSSAGLDSNQYSGHSLRSGFATSTAALGVDERSIMSMTGHKSPEMVRRYIKESNLFKNNALNALK